MRASRLVSLLLLLQHRGRVTAGELAEALEVSVRTIYRDLEALSAAGVPVYAEPGRNGGCQLVGGYRTRLTGLTAKEAEALFATGMTGPVGELGLGTVLGAAQLKLLAALPKDLADRAASARQRFHFDAPTWFRTSRNEPQLAALAAAVWDDQRVDIRYRHPGADEPAPRTLDPFGLVNKAGVWYLVARAARARCARTGCRACTTSPRSTSTSTGRRVSISPSTGTHPSRATNHCCHRWTSRRARRHMASRSWGG